MYLFHYLRKTLWLKIFNSIIRSSKNKIYFIPHPNCITDKYDLINFHSDNVLVFFNYLLQRKSLKGYTLYIEVYDKERIEDYKAYCSSINPNIIVKFIFVDKERSKWQFNRLICLCRCAMIFTSTFYYDFTFKTKDQKVICLGYYTPFKDDYHLNNTYFEKQRSITNQSFDYYITASALASRIIAIDSGIGYYKFYPYGILRNYYLLHEQNERSIKEYIRQKTGYIPLKIIVYTPTYRDYERSNNIDFRSVWGYENCDTSALFRILLKYQAVIFLKLHPLQNKNIILEDIPSNILLYHSNYNFSLYDILSVSDCLITDYTSTYFDYLIKNKPVIFNFYDVKKYRKVRGFSYEPIEMMCAGDIAYSYQELLNAIESALEGKDHYKEERDKMNQGMNTYSVDNIHNSIYDLLFVDY